MKHIQRLLGGLIGVSAILILLTTSFEIAAYGDASWYEKEYAKYGVLEELEMEMEDVMHVTKEMMAYLRGDRNDLVVDTIVDGKEREFFNDREKAHMVDVKEMFMTGLWMRRIAVLIVAISVLLLWKTKAKLGTMLPKTFLISIGSFVGVTALAGMLFLSDFSKYFTIFHELFFDNDLWLLDPATDLMIRMLPEEFFLDMVVRIGVVFMVLMVLVLIISIAILKWHKNKKN